MGPGNQPPGSQASSGRRKTGPGKYGKLYNPLMRREKQKVSVDVNFPPLMVIRLCQEVVVEAAGKDALSSSSDRR